MNGEQRVPLPGHFSLHCAARWMLCALLAGYLIFNKPFAQLGFPPLYIGEMVLAVCLIATLQWLGPAFLTPIRQSWTFRLIAIFLAYALLRAATGYLIYGWSALRDSTVVGYALLAFVAPAVLARAAPTEENDEAVEL